MFAQVIPEIRQGERDLATGGWGNHLGVNEAAAVIADVAALLAEAFGDIRDLRRPIVLSHIQQEGAVDIREVCKSWLVNELA